MRQQFAIGAKKSGAATTVVRLALRWGGTNQSVLSVHRSECRSEVCFLSSIMQGGGVVRDLDLYFDLDLGPDPILSTTQNTQHTTTSALTQAIQEPAVSPGSSSRCQPRSGIAGIASNWTHCPRSGPNGSLILLIMGFLTSFRGLRLPFRK